MGEVYRARDTRLSRDVAIKILPAGVASDPERLRRFERRGRRRLSTTAKTQPARDWQTWCLTLDCIRKQEAGFAKDLLGSVGRGSARRNGTGHAPAENDEAEVPGGSHPSSGSSAGSAGFRRLVRDARRMETAGATGDDDPQGPRGIPAQLREASSRKRCERTSIAIS